MADLVAMNRIVPIIETSAVTLQRFDHSPAAAHRDADREQAARHAVSFVEAGSFCMRTSGHWHRLSADQLVVTRPGLEFSCAHDDEYPTDSCLTVSYSEQAVESLRGTGVRFSERLVRANSNRRAYLRLALLSCRRGDEARVESLAAALQWSLSADPPRRALFRADQLTWYARRIERTKAMIAARYAEPLSLSAMARDAGMSMYHFARVFAELEGVPPHRFLTAIRLAHAEARLRQGASVTETCFAIGFGSLSHFVTTFRQRYGATPSALRARSIVRAQARPRRVRDHR